MFSVLSREGGLSSRVTSLLWGNGFSLFRLLRYVYLCDQIDCNSAHVLWLGMLICHVGVVTGRKIDKILPFFDTTLNET